MAFTFIVFDDDGPSTGTFSRFSVGAVLSILNGFVVPIIFEFPASSSTYIHKYQSSPVTSAGLEISCPGVTEPEFSPVKSPASGFGVFPSVHKYFIVSSFTPASFSPSVGSTVTL